MSKEKNKLIAEFMGVIDDDGTLNCPDGIMINPYHDSEIRYDESWDWLMPVVEKIKSLGICYGDNGYNFIEAINRNLLECSISGVFESCDQFIKWYNENL